MAITTLLFISTAVVFWATDYSYNVLNGEHDEVMATFVTVCVTAPTSGIILGGIFVQKVVGGYEAKHSILACFSFALIAGCCALPVKMIDSVLGFGVMLWFVLFFGGAVIPNLQGVMISSLKEDLRAAGNSISNILQNLIGFLPAPFCYGLIYNIHKDSDPKLAMALTLWYSFVGVILVVFGMYFRYMKYGNEDSREETTSIVNSKRKSNLKEINKEIEISRHVNSK